MLTPDQVADFQRDGFLILRRFVDVSVVDQLREVTYEGIARHILPIEYEADVQYPGSPASRDAEGGETIRRLKNAIARHPAFVEWINDRSLVEALSQLLPPPIVMPLAHHNCVMTKQPTHSSETGWHQDIRYWSYRMPDLISVWLALTSETPENGSLMVMPGTHRMQFPPERLDEMKFLREDVPENAPLFESVVSVTLDPGDVLLFHCRTFHAADRNRTPDPKLSAVFTFRGADNPPLPGSRSAKFPELLLSGG